MSLFLKIFLWFWLAMALVVGAVILVSWSTQNEPIRRQWQTAVADSTQIQTQNATQIYENEGVKGLDTFLQRLENSDRVTTVGYFIGNRQISGGQLPENTTELVKKTLESDKVEYNVTETETLFAEKVALKNGETAVFVIQWERPRYPQTDWKTRILQILAAVFTTGLVCYGLARYLVAPIVKLQAAAKNLSEGDLQTRIELKRRDELGKLAQDFNQMAQRIESLVLSQKTLNRDISHELRTPLARLGVALELARTKSNNETQPHLARIERESYRLNEMISQILTLSKLETGLSNFQASRINLAKIVKEVVADANFETSNGSKQIEIAENEDAYVEGNERLLQSAIENIIRNAVKYTPENSAVKVTLEKENGIAKISVRDYGKGVEDAKLKDLFRPFYRVDEARERKSGGVGLGLAITERAVSAHGGKVWAENAADGGLIVKIELPLNQKIENRSPEKNGLTAKSRQPKVEAKV